MTTPVDPRSATLVERIEQAWGATLQSDAAPGATIKDRSEGGASEARASQRPTLPASTTIRFAEGLEVDDGAPVDRVDGSHPLGGRGPAAFEVLRRVGAGGMGVVYAARQATLAREVALKMVRSEHAASAHAEERFIAEALVTGELDHPNIVPVHDLGRDTAGNIFMAMRLVRGTGWDRLLHPPPDDADAAARASRMGLRDHLDVLLRVCDAISFAHAHSIVHRDLKPENILVGRFGEVVVMDWGIALDVSEGAQAAVAAKAEHKSRTSGPAGTPRYMAPEQALADVDDIGPRTDVFLLGAILYEVLTGTPPHEGRSVNSVLLAAAECRIMPPETRAPARTVPRELSRIALKAMAARTLDRFPDVASLQAALKEFLAHEESLKLAEAATADLRRLEEAGGVPPEERYALFGRCVQRLTEALRLWPQNEEARTGEARAALAYAEEAFDRDDIGLAAAQVPLLEGNAATDPARLDALRAALARRRARRRRSIAAGLVILVAIALISIAARALGDGTAREGAEREREEAARAALRDAWRAVREEGRDGLAVARGKLADAGAAGLAGRAQERLLGLDLARDVRLWAEGRREELCLVGGLPTLGKATAARLAGLAGVSGTALAEDLLRAGAVSEYTPPSVGRVLVAAARGAAPLEALEALLEGALASSGLDPRRAALRRAAVLGLAREEALRRGDAATAARLAGRESPFLLSEAPFGGPDADARGGPAPLVHREPGGAYVAVDPATGAPRWRASPFGESQAACARAVPVADGSVVVAGMGQAVRLSGATGAVLGRAWLDGEAVLAFPDPLDPAALSLVVVLDENRGEAHPVSIRGGRLDPPYSQGEQFMAVVAARHGPEALKKALSRKGADGRAPAPHDVAAALGRAGAADPTNPYFALQALDVIGATATAEAQADLGRRAARAIAAAFTRDAGSPVILAMLVAGRLETIGLPEEAAALTDAAARRFLDLGGNADLASFLNMNPAMFLRNAGGKLFAKGEVDRALALVESGRRFSTVMEADHWFYARQAAWLRWKGRDAEAAVAAARAKEAERGGGFLMFPASYLVAADVILFAAAMAPWVLIILVGRLWWRARPGVTADLRARGMRTALARSLAWATHPVERLRYGFLSYASRAERAAVALTAIVFLASASFTTGAVRTIAEVAAVPISIGSGYAGSDGVTRFVEERHGRRGERAFSLRILAEGRARRGDPERARALYERALSLEPADPVARTGIAFADEAQGRLEAARAGYARAASEAAADDPRAAAARWNLARLDGRFQGLAPAALTATAEWRALPHRDRLHADHAGPARALLAACPHEDLFETVVQEKDSAAAFLRDGFGALVSGRFSALTALSMGGEAPALDLSKIVLDTAGYGSILLALLALLWLPARVLPLPTPAPLDARAAFLDRAKDAGTAALGLAIPGLYDLARGRPARGALVLCLLVGAHALRMVLVHGGIIGNIAIPSVGAGYFDDAPAEIFASSWDGAVIGATVVIALLYLGNAAATVARWRRARRAEGSA